MITQQKSESSQTSADDHKTEVLLLPLSSLWSCYIHIH